MAIKASQRRKFDELITRLKGVAKENPQQYRSQVFWLGVLGYAYIILILLAFLALIGLILYLCLHHHTFNTGVMKVLIFCVFVAFVILKSLWVKLHPPQGLQLQRSDCPRLFEFLSTIASRVKAPVPDTVLLTDDFNASISQLPRLGIFGWHKNYLCLGLPLMQVLTEEEFAAVVAHEFGHISSAHGRTGCWIYRIRETWSRLYESFEREPSAAVFLFVPFFKWYVPYFTAYSFVLAREQEYEADRQAAEITSPSVLARALLVIDVKGTQFGLKTWPGIYRLTSRQPEPPSNVFALVATALHQEDPDGLKWLKHALNVRTHNSDTHPCLADRIRAVGCESVLGKPMDVPQASSVHGSAAYTIFSERGLADITVRMNTAWKTFIAATWKDRYKYVQQEMPVLEKLLAGSDLPAGISENEAVELLQKIEELFGPEVVFPWIQKLLDRFPANVPANFRYGEFLLGRDDVSGIAYLEKAWTANSLLRTSAYDQISAFYERQGEYKKAQEYYDEAGTHEDLAALAYAERNQLGKGDALEPHGLSTEKIGELRVRLASILSDVTEMYLVRKKLKYAPEDPFWVVYISSHSPVLKYRSEDFPRKLAEQTVNILQGYFDRGGYLVLVDQKAFRSKFRKVARACVYKRGGKP